MLRKPLVCLAILILLSACKDPPAAAISSSSSAATTLSPPPPTAAPHIFTPDITPADFSELVKTLASDEFEGRGPGSPGEDKSVDYIRANMQRIGLLPGSGDSYYQNVPMVETRIAAGTTVRLQAGDKPLDLKLGDDLVIGTRTGQTEIKIENSAMIFVGYGVNAPERGWNDYTGQDWKGKTVVMFVNDPGFHKNDESLFDGKRMTYYGRWTYKFEEAARRGAAAALIVHDDEGAAYGWEVVKNSWSGPQYDLPAAADPEPRLPIQGWITTATARALFAAAGLQLDETYTLASQPGFTPIPLKSTFSVNLKNTVTEKISRNVIGVLPGSSHADEAVIYMAHWDHLGKHEGQDGDVIYNGAVDNATGVAGILEIAEAFAHQNPKPERSVVFLATTLEESGLLGSKYYVTHPTFPLAKIAGVINIDTLSVAGRAKDMTVIGLGSSELEDILKPIATEQGRFLRPETSPQSGLYFRSDHFNFAKAGIPALYIGGGMNLRQGGPEAGRRAADEYHKDRYHQPSDEFDPVTWKFDGTIEDLQALYGVGKELAGSDKWPRWYEGNEFKAAQDRLRPPPATATPQSP
jgi:Zn-dependent M28 family amino/carboxypeptidase